MTKISAPLGTDRILNRVTFRPYLDGQGPVFRLITWDCGRPYRGGPQWCVGYRLSMRENGKHTLLFQGEDYGCAPGHSIDSKDCVRALMSFLTCKPGDTDSDYFADYTPRQREYCSQHAEALSSAVDERCGRDE